MEFAGPRFETHHEREVPHVATHDLHRVDPTSSPSRTIEGDRLSGREASWLCAPRAPLRYPFVAGSIAKSALAHARPPGRSRAQRRARHCAATPRTSRARPRHSDTEGDVRGHAPRFLDETYEPWMKATYRGRTGQVARIRAAFGDLLDLRLSEFNTARIDRWRTARRNGNAIAEGSSKRKSRDVSRSTINRDISALRAALTRAVEWGTLSAMPLGKIKRSTEDENAIVRYLIEDEEARLRAALLARDDARRAARESANMWRRPAGVRGVAGVRDVHRPCNTARAAGVNTGLRRGELLQLCWRDVDLQRRS